VSLALIAGTALGCAASAGLSNMWRDPAYTPTPYTKVYVIAIKKDPTRRRLAEDAFVAGLQTRGVESRQSYRDFPNAVPDSQQIQSAFEQGGFDGVITVSHLEPTTQTTYVRGYVTTASYVRWNPYRQQYMVYYRRIYQPGYVETSKTVRHQVDVWSPSNGGSLVWTGVTESVDPASLNDINQQMVSRVLPELQKQGFLPRK
jgi:hypothetical protein